MVTNNSTVSSKRKDTATPRSDPSEAVKKSKTNSKKKQRNKEIDGDGTKDHMDSEEEFDSSEIFIPKTAVRPTGKVEYEAEKIHTNTLLYLRDLKQNNEREWFWQNEPEYRRAKKDFDEFIEALSERMIEIDNEIPPLPLNDIEYRI